jgi:hypothetical protein
LLSTVLAQHYHYQLKFDGAEEAKPGTAGICKPVLDRHQFNFTLVGTREDSGAQFRNSYGVAQSQEVKEDWRI